MDHPHATHLKILGIVHLIFGGLGLLMGVVVALFFALGMGAVATQSNDPDAAAAMGVMAVLAVVVVGLVALCSLPQLLAGWGLLKGKSWARIVILVVSALSLLSIPLGTALGIYGFWALLHQDVEPAMASLNPDHDLYG